MSILVMWGIIVFSTNLGILLLEVVTQQEK